MTKEEALNLELRKKLHQKCSLPINDDINAYIPVLFENRSLGHRWKKLKAFQAIPELDPNLYGKNGELVDVILTLSS